MNETAQKIEAHLLHQEYYEAFVLFDDYKTNFVIPTDILSAIAQLRNELVHNQLSVNFNVRCRLLAREIGKLETKPLQDTLQALEKQHKALQKEHEELLHEQKNHQENNQETIQRYRKANAELLRIKNEYSTIVAEKEAYQEALATQKNNQIHPKKITELEVIIAERETQITTLKNNLTAKETKLTEIQTVLTTKETQITKLQKDLAKEKDNQELLNIAQNEINQKIKRITQQEKALLDGQKVYTQLQEKYNQQDTTLKQKDTKLTEIQTVYAVLQARYNTLETEYNLLKTPIAQPKINTQNATSYTETIKGVSFEMIKIPNQNFYMAETQVTQAMWQAVMGNNPSYFAGKLQNPVEKVSWKDIVNDFLPALNKLTGKTYLLPTEAEWEYSAMGGENYQYPGSDNIDEVACYDKNSGKTTHPVKQKKANAYGLYDMSGNVLEWCEDAWEDIARRVCRGGSYRHDSEYCAPHGHHSRDAEYRYYDIGLRVVFSASSVVI